MSDEWKKELSCAVNCSKCDKELSEGDERGPRPMQKRQAPAHRNLPFLLSRRKEMKSASECL